MKKSTLTCSKKSRNLLLTIQNIFLALSFLFAATGVWGQSTGFNNTFVVLSVNGGANTFYDLNAATANTDFNGANLGSFAAGTNNLVFKGAEHNVYKCGGADITSTRVYYRIYLTSAGASGTFTSNNIGYTSGFNNGCGGQDQVWSNTGYTINLLSGLAPGNYSIQVYSDASTSLGDRFASNGGSNYTASFTVTGNYYSKSTGNLDLTSSWGTNTDGTGNAPANFTTAGNTFNIRNNPTPTIGANWTVSGTGSKVIVGNGTNACTFTIPSGFSYSSTATDISASATLRNQNTTVTSLGTCIVAGTYEHNANGGTIPTATWQTNSTCNITGSTGSTDLSGLGQSFFNFTYNCSGGQENINTGAFAVTNTFSMPSTNAGTIRIGTSVSNFSISVKDFSLAGGTFILAASTTSNSTQTLAITGAFSMSGGILDLSASSTGTGTITVAGNFTHSGGTIQKTNGTGSITLNGITGTQTLESTGQTNTAGSAIAFSVAGSNAQCVISATKTFTLSSGSTFQIANGSSNPDLSINGTFINISAVTNGFGNAYASSGNISLNNGGTYVHNTIRSVADYLAIATNNSGSTVIYRGSSTLTPSISLSGRTYHHLTIESTSGALSLSGTGSSSFIVNGDLTVGANCTFGPNVTGTPGHSIKGNITIGSGGTLNYSPSVAGTINLNGSGTQTISGAGTFTTGANATLAVGASSTIDFGATNAIAGSGTFTTASGSTLITANASGINGSLTLANNSLNAATNYTFNGASAQVTGASVTSANNIILNNSAGLTLSAGTAVNGTLTLTNGKLTLGASDLTLGVAASVSGASSTKYLVTNNSGQLKKAALTTAFTFPVGNSAYNPISITNSGTSDTYGINVTDGAVADATVSSECVNRRWYISEGTSGGGNLSVTPQYNTGEPGASFSSVSQVYIGLYVPTTWTKTAATVSGSNPFTASASGFNQSLTSNSYFAIGNEGIYITTPTITTTVAASAITNTTAASGGQTITGINITEKGVVWNTATAPTVVLSTKTNDGTGSADFISSLTSLSPQTLYYIRAYATNAAGTGYGDEKTFRTLSNPATAQASGLSATATSSSNIDLAWTVATFPSSGATTKGYVLLRATAPYTPALGNANGSAPTAGANTTIVSSAIAENATSISSSGLAASTQYNYLLIPYTWDGTNATTYNYLTASAPTANATTQSGSTPPVLTTNAASSVLSTTATLNGEITSDGGSSVTARGFVYSTSDNTPTIGEGGVTDQASGSGTGTFNSSVSSLSPNTTYYYQAYATSASGTSYGGVISFTTLKAEPSAQATSLVFSSITTSSFNTAFTAATGSPDGYLVIRSTSASLSANPVDGTTYTAGNSLGGSTIVSVGSTISGISNTGLTSGTTYYTFVFAYNNSGANIDYLITSPLSASTITLTDAPATPTFSSITTTGFTVNWTATSGASSYRLDVSTVSNFASFVTGYQDLSVNGSPQVVTGLTANTLYYVRVRAVNASGISASSTSANSATLPNAPTVGTASSITTSGLTANWTAPSSQGAATFTYTVELSTNSSDFSIPVSTASNIASGTTTNAFSSLSEGTTYYYRIKSVNSAGSSAWSSVSAGATTLTSYVSLTALGTSETQNFDGMLSSTSLPSGWRMHASNPTPSWSIAATSLTQQASSGTPNTGGTYNWGTSATERGVGAMTSSSFASPNQLLVYTKNNTGSIITNFSIAYTAERYRVNSAAASVKFYYSTNGSSWTEVLDGEIISSNFPAGTSSYTFSTPLEIERTFIISGLSIASNADFYLRWDINTTGSNSQGIGIDDVSIKPCGTVSAPSASNQVFCSAATPTVANLTATGTAVQWYAASTGGTALSTSTSLTNNTTYYATQTMGGCESVTRTAVLVTLNTNPSAPTGSATQVQCSGATVSNLSATGSSIQWYAASTGGSPLATNTTLVNGSTYYASQTTNSCESTTRLAVTSSIVNTGSWIGAASSDWSDAANWCGGVPSSSTSVTVPSGTPFPLIISSSVSVNALTINAGATVSTSGTPNIVIANNGSFTNNGTFTAGSSKVSFSGVGTVSGTLAFNDVDIAGGVNFGTASTINGTLTINTNGWVNTNAPSYGANSLLKYNAGGVYGRGFEWGTTSGPGYPNDVQISNNTTLDYPNAAGAFTANIGIARDLIIDAGSNFYMDYGNGTSSGALTIGRNAQIAGNISLGDQFGGDIYLKGNWTRTAGNFNSNQRAIFLTGNTNQTISSYQDETFPYLIVDKSGGAAILNCNLNVTGELTLTNGKIQLGTNNLFMGGASLIGGSNSSYVQTTSTGTLSRLVGTSDRLFPVGNTTYNPATLRNVNISGLTTAPDNYSIRVIDNVTNDGTGNGTGTSLAVIPRTWMVNEQVAGGSNITMKLDWNGVAGVNSFNPVNAFMAHYISSAGLWDNIGGAVVGTTVEAPGIQSFSPFTISSSPAFAPLPIELVSFQANCAGDDKINVTWTTASEHNTSHYTVEKSLDGMNWSVLGHTSAAGNSTQLLNYEMIDIEKVSGVKYYRLIQFDIDGAFEQFNAVAVDCDNMNSNTTLSAYPNPSDNSFYISLFTEEMDGAGVITITDTKGAVVHTQNVNIQNGNSVFYMNNMQVAPGMYYIQVTNGNKSTDIVKHSLR